MTDHDSPDTPVTCSKTHSYPSANAFRFFRDRQGRTFELAELEEATGWRLTTIRTYVVKKWQHFLQPLGNGVYRVTNFDVSEDEFLAQQPRPLRDTITM